MPALRRAIPGALLFTLLFLLAWAFLNAVVNLRYPAPLAEPSWWYLLPSVDVVVLLLVLAGLGWMGRRLPFWVLGVLAVLFVWVRLFRTAQGLIELNYYRQLNLALDMPLLPELARLLHSTLSLPRFILAMLLFVSGLGLCLLLLFGSLWYAQRFLAGGHWQRGVLAGVLVVVASLWTWWPKDNRPDLHIGLFAQSVLAPHVHQVRLAAAGKNHRLIKATDIQNKQRALARLPAGLERLGKRDVFFFLVESYGATALLKPQHFSRLAPMFDRFIAKIATKGLEARSTWLDSPTYGGASWLAHGTLATGVRIHDALEYAVLLGTQPPPLTLATIFGRAGWRTVTVQPGMTRPFPEGIVHGFAAKYYLAAFNYQGPSFGWAPLPDQFAIDFIHRKEVLPAKSPLFIQYALVSSHAPWSVQAPLIEDWSTVGDGSIYKGITPYRYPVSWTNITEGGDAYADSLLYDFGLIEHYLTEMLTRDALVIILGDHQPPGVAAPDPSRAVPLHVVSRDPELLARFEAAGFVPGMIPGQTGQIRGMETFLPLLLEQLSNPQR
jgi:hypothetical protein